MGRDNLWIVAYDSPSNKRRRKLARLLEGYGQRVQWSVFECRLQPDDLRRLSQLLKHLIHPEQDSVRLWPVPERSCAQIQHLGRPVASADWADKVI